MDNCEGELMSVRRTDEGTLDYDWVIAELQRAVEGQKTVEIKPIEHIINCDAQPLATAGQSFRTTNIPNRVQGSFQWNPAQVKLYLSDQQRNGHELKKARRQRSPACQCPDYLLANKHLIPRGGKASPYSSGELSTATRMATRLCVTCLGTATGGTGATSGLFATGTTTTPRRCAFNYRR